MPELLLTQTSTAAAELLTDFTLEPASPEATDLFPDQYTELPAVPALVPTMAEAALQDTVAIADVAPQPRWRDRLANSKLGRLALGTLTVFGLSGAATAVEAAPDLC